MQVNTYTGSKNKRYIKPPINTLFSLGIYLCMHTIVQMVNTILEYINPYYLYLLIQYSKSCGLTEWVRCHFIMLHTCPIRKRSGDHNGQVNYQTFCRVYGVVWASYRWALFSWKRTSHSCYRNGNRMGWTMFWTYMALFRVLSTNIKGEIEL